MSPWVPPSPLNRLNTNSDSGPDEVPKDVLGSSTGTPLIDFEGPNLGRCQVFPGTIVSVYDLICRQRQERQ